MLSKHRPQRTYGEQWIVDEVDAYGTCKALLTRIDECDQAGDMHSMLLYMGAHIALSTMFVEDGVDYWTDFMREFDAKVGYITELQEEEKQEAEDA